MSSKKEIAEAEKERNEAREAFLEKAKNSDKATRRRRRIRGRVAMHRLHQKRNGEGTAREA